MFWTGNFIVVKIGRKWAVAEETDREPSDFQVVSCRFDRKSEAVEFVKQHQECCEYEFDEADMANALELMDIIRAEAEMN